MFGLGFGELVLIFLIALIFIGPKKLPELARGLGQGLKEFQKAAKGFSDQIQEDVNAPVRRDEKPKLNDVASTAGGDAPLTTPAEQSEKPKEEKPS